MSNNICSIWYFPALENCRIKCFSTNRIISIRCNSSEYTVYAPVPLKRLRDTNANPLVLTLLLGWRSACPKGQGFFPGLWDDSYFLGYTTLASGWGCHNLSYWDKLPDASFCWHCAIFKLAEFNLLTKCAEFFTFYTVGMNRTTTGYNAAGNMAAPRNYQNCQSESFNLLMMAWDVIVTNPSLWRDFERLLQYNIGHLYSLIFVLTRQARKPHSFLGNYQ